MAEKAKELNNRKDGDRRQCPICAPPRAGTVRMDKVWAATLKHGGSSHR